MVFAGKKAPKLEEAEVWFFIFSSKTQIFWILYFPLYNNSKKWHWQEDFGWLGLLLHNHYHSSFNGFQKIKHLSNINNRKILLILCDNDRSTRHLMNCHHATNFWIVSRNDDNKFSPLLFVNTTTTSKKMAAIFFSARRK